MDTGDRPLPKVSDAAPAAANSLLAEALALADGFALRSRAAATEREYTREWDLFSCWCLARGIAPLPAAPAHVAAFLAHGAATVRVPTLQKRLAAIAARHRQAGFAFDGRDPAIREVWAGIRRTLGVAGTPKQPLTAGELAHVVAGLPATTAGIRDRALLLLTFGAALRRSETVGLDVADLRFVGGEGLALTIRTAKADQEGRGLTKGVPLGQRPETCPVRAVKNWLMRAGLDGGPLFRSVDRFGRIGATRLTPGAVTLILKSAVRRPALVAGASRAEADRRAAAIAAHSLRAGWCSSAAAAGGVTDAALAAHCGHASTAMVRRYVRLPTLFANHPGRATGL